MKSIIAVAIAVTLVVTGTLYAFSSRSLPVCDALTETFGLVHNPLKLTPEFRKRAETSTDPDVTDPLQMQGTTRHFETAVMEARAQLYDVGGWDMSDRFTEIHIATLAWLGASYERMKGLPPRTIRDATRDHILELCNT